MSSSRAEGACKVKREAKAFFDTLGIDDAYMDSHYDRCYCERCYKSDWPDTINNDGSHVWINGRATCNMPCAMEHTIHRPHGIHHSKGVGPVRLGAAATREDKDARRV